MNPTVAATIMSALEDITKCRNLEDAQFIAAVALIAGSSKAEPRVEVVDMIPCEGMKKFKPEHETFYLFTMPEQCNGCKPSNPHCDHCKPTAAVKAPIVPFPPCRN